ncbi:hypothetical protein CBP34_11670 [Acidovorax carolinensis]|uniref:Uncharacterized protein n=1 Tax=Acidovorax carolinensis TaxID=553814 RepID=A0A240U478_9BURK|nr:hypothetical protein [Acidovorax carolinensis]ART52178.1 hypothetical protein CBP34_11670 [Acidovorax carolinensis]
MSGLSPHLRSYLKTPALAREAADFIPGEAAGLRRTMAAWKRKGSLGKYYNKIVGGMTSRGYPRRAHRA